VSTPERPAADRNPDGEPPRLQIVARRPKPRLRALLAIALIAVIAAGAEAIAGSAAPARPAAAAPASAASSRPDVAAPARVAPSRPEARGRAETPRHRGQRVVGRRPVHVKPARVTVRPVAHSGATQWFSGAGERTIGTMTVAAPSTLRWSCPRCARSFFILYNNPDDVNQMPVDSANRTAGAIPLPAGRYDHVTVLTGGGAWKLDVIPDALPGERP
jgi:hypothetical protein